MPAGAFRVHVIDDDEAVRESLEALLLVSGFEVATYRSAEEYLGRAEEPEGCILLDVNMPGMSGLDLMRDLARRGPVLVLSASHEPRLRSRAFELGARAFLTKPVPEAALVAALHAAQA
jgi:two-component system response regulator FixJ